MKVVKITDAGFVWHVPLSAIADHRAKYYAANDPHTTYDEEFDYIMDDKYEGLDWFWNNMDFADIADQATLVATPAPKKEPGPDAEAVIVTVLEQAARVEEIRQIAEKMRAAAYDAEVEALKEALEQIEGMGFDAPATFIGSDLDWANRRASLMQSIARAAIKEIQK